MLHLLGFVDTRSYRYIFNIVEFNAQCHGLKVHVQFQKSKHPFSIEMRPLTPHSTSGPKVWYILVTFPKPLVFF